MNRDKYDYCPPGISPDMKLAHAYVPNQVMGQVFSPQEALQKGTLFPELYMPYVPEKYDKNRKKVF